MTWQIWLILAVCGLVVIVRSLAAFGALRWADASRVLRRGLAAARIDAAGRPPGPPCFDIRELDGLPMPVQAFFRIALQPGQPLVAAVDIALAGNINLSAKGVQWKVFRAHQRVVTRRPGFVWDASVAWLPGLAVRVVDAYVAGQGRLRAAVLGLFTLAELQGDGELARGELMRFFAETAWYPTALLPSQGVRWQAVDTTSADATITDGGLTLTLRFRFNAAGLIESAHADARGAMVGKTLVMLPWEGRWTDYQRRAGMMVPLTGEAAWLRPEGRKPYFVGHVTSIDFEFLA